MPQLLKCPRCLKPLTSVTAQAAVSWRCLSCRGASIGLVVLKRLAPPERVATIWKSVWGAEKPDGVACPSCSSHMRKLDLDGLALQGCRSCLLVWFEGEELRKFAPKRQESSATPSELTRAAKQAIAIAAAQGLENQAARAQDAMRDRARQDRKRRTQSLDALVSALLG
jgi:Zn-finger nucleic acid-binding protein